jgi:hypothetical protein
MGQVQGIAKGDVGGKVEGVVKRFGDTARAEQGKDLYFETLQCSKFRWYFAATKNCPCTQVKIHK